LQGPLYGTDEITGKRKCHSESNSFVAAVEQVHLEPVLEHRQRRYRCESRYDTNSVWASGWQTVLVTIVTCISGEVDQQAASAGVFISWNLVSSTSPHAWSAWFDATLQVRWV